MLPAPPSKDKVEYPICRPVGAAASGLVLAIGQSALAFAQPLTPEPGAWRPLAYVNFQQPSPREATYFDIWKDAIDANNRSYAARGDQRFVAGNAPATEAHFVIWSPKRSVVLSILNTALGCSEKTRDRDVRVVVKFCPMRVAIYDGLQVRTMNAGRACFVEPESGATLDATAAGAYGSYDVAARTLKIGLIVNHRAVEGCAFSIPLARE